MDGWMDGWLNEWLAGRMVGQREGRMCREFKNCTVIWTDGRRVDGYMYRIMDLLSGGPLDISME
jgi:hypothetical protein